MRGMIIEEIEEERDKRKEYKEEEEDRKEKGGKEREKERRVSCSTGHPLYRDSGFLGQNILMREIVQSSENFCGKVSSGCDLKSLLRGGTWIQSILYDEVFFYDMLAILMLPRGLPRLKFEKDLLCSVLVNLEKSKEKFSHRLKSGNNKYWCWHISSKHYVTVNVDILKSAMFLGAKAVAMLVTPRTLVLSTNDLAKLGKFQAKAGHYDFSLGRSGPEHFIKTPGQLKSGLAPTGEEHLEMLF
ncbi:hypothetical protein Tco_1502971 [Tanacetum coccineum]